MPLEGRFARGLSAWLIGLAALSSAGEAGEWRQYRGDGRGRSMETGLPTSWSEEHNITWKTAIPGRGWSSPVVVDGMVWMTTALEEDRSLRLVGVDLKDGRILHDLEVFSPPEWQPGHPDNSYASPTPAGEPGRICVHFGTYGTACYTTEGRLIWRRQAFIQNHDVGPGSSPILWRDLLIINCDATDSQFVAALNKETGDLVWQTPRRLTESRKPPHRKAFSTPFIFHHRGRPLLLSTGATHTSAYDPNDGREVWWFPHDGYSNVAMPMVGLGLAFVNTGYMKPHLLALRLGGEGEIAEDALRWSYYWQVPANPSPLLIGGRIFMVNEAGNATWLDAAKGEDIWRQRLKGKHYASPLAAHGKIFVWSIAGKTRVLKAADTFEILAENTLNGEIRATPAIADGALFIRTDQHLYRVENRPDDEAP